jgi:HK97 family phage prohead protease
MIEETRDAHDGVYPLSPRQIAMYSADEKIVDLFGKYDQGSGPDGAHYMRENPFAEEGVQCSSCSFFEGGNACEIVDGEILPTAICKRWVIAGDLVALPSNPAQIPEDAMVEEPAANMAPVRYTAVEVEARKVAGRDVEFRTVEVGGLELRAVQDDTTGMPMRFSGYAAVFDSPSEPLPFIETIAPGAFSRSLQSGRETRMFLNHNTDQVLASTKSGSLTVTEDSRGLMVDAQLPDTSYGRDLSVLIQRGDVHSMSFGFSVPSGGESRSADGQSRRLNEVILHEVSVVTGFAAYAATEGAQVRTTEELTAEPADEPTPGRSVALAQRYLALNAKR